MKHIAIVYLSRNNEIDVISENSQINEINECTITQKHSETI